ncbi:MAG TPA: methyltransferase domain-containing protein [Candidatus Binatia bacterium]
MKRSLEKEMMDLPGNAPRLLEGELYNLKILNRALGGRRGILRCLAALAEQNRFSLLDVGTGGADIPIAIVLWARRRGIAARIVALEPDPVAAALARRETRDFPEISILRGDGFKPPFKPGAFDFVLASQVLHHFSEADITALLRAWAGLARRALLVSDLVRHPLAYCGIWLLTGLFTRNVMTRRDAPLSVRRAFTVEEWQRLFRSAGVGPARVLALFPFRMIAHIRLRHEAV